VRWHIALALVAAAACAHSPQPEPDEGVWAKERDRWTRSGKIYDRLDSVAFASATYQAATVRRARVERLWGWRVATAEERQAALAREEAEGARFEEFFLAFYTTEPRHNDLANGNTIWRVALVVPGSGELLAESVSELDGHHEDYRKLYSYVRPFDAIYRVRFPRGEQAPALSGREFTLRIAGSAGRVDLHWKPDNHSAPPSDVPETAFFLPTPSSTTTFGGGGR
jgi:hypothetical protein